MDFESIDSARRLLGLPEQATMDEIRGNYRALVKRWHPDTCDEDPARSEGMIRRVTEAYRLLMEYCAMYRFSFTRDEVGKYLSDAGLWRSRFGEDPIWG